MSDLREDRAYLADQMGSNIITSAQVCSSLLQLYCQQCFGSYFLVSDMIRNCNSVAIQVDDSDIMLTQGEELRKQIGAAAYIECSSKTQQVNLISFIYIVACNVLPSCF